MQKIKITRDHAKKAARGVVSFTVVKTVKSAIKNNATTETKFQNASASVGAWIIGALVADLVKEKTNETVDKAIDKVKEVKTQIDTLTAQTQTD